MFKPLKNIKVIDLTGVLAGPYSTYQLALLGAEVIKIENLDCGDWTRLGGKDKDLNKQLMGTSFLIQNSDKKSVQIDLKSTKGKEIALNLIKSADVFVENMRPGKADSLGLGWEQISSIHNKIVYCSISAYGQDGPLKKRGAYDHVVQGMTGIMTTTGTKESGPTKVGAPYIDYATGLNAAFAITAALHEIKESNKSIRIDVSMMDTSLLLMANMVTEHLNSGWIPQPMGNEAQSGSPSSGMYKTKTDPILLAANNNTQFLNLCDALNTIKPFDKEKWKLEENRKNNTKELREELQDIFNLKTAEFLESLLNNFDVPSGKIRTLPEVLSEEQFIERKLWNNVNIKSINKNFLVPSIGFKINQNAVVPENPPPLLGGDTKSILNAIDINDDEIDTLRKQEIIN
ncbi:CoA transferase [Alphaproteobacteria bacterium]|nr:CoA transferase [Alphaproteobacteria bacterium]